MGVCSFFISFIICYFSNIIVEKKWHRSPKMDKNKCPKIKSAQEILQKTPPPKTRCEHNAANPDFSLEILTAHFF